MKVKIATLHHSHDIEEDISVHRDEDAARATLHRDVVTPGWDNIHCADGTTCGIHGCTGVNPTIGVYDTDEAIQIYFAHRADFEHRTIETHEVDLTQPPVPDYVKHPELTAGVNHADVTGRLHVAFTDADTAFVTTEPHDPLTYRDKPFRVSVRLARNTDGTWTPTTRNGGLRLTRQDTYPERDAAPTHAEKLLAAITHTTAEHWTPEIGERARYANASQALRHLFQRRDSLLIELEAISAEAGPLLGITRTYVPPTD